VAVPAPLGWRNESSQNFAYLGDVVWLAQTSLPAEVASPARNLRQVREQDDPHRGRREVGDEPPANLESIRVPSVIMGTRLERACLSAPGWLGANSFLIFFMAPLGCLLQVDRRVPEDVLGPRNRPKRPAEILVLLQATGEMIQWQ
jgi:hypothetical protein